LKESFNVIPAKAGIQSGAFTFWIPASPGMTDRSC
jgi:hypothetical protein